ncbi:unnamed protein product [Psylliodes chrysocephalus]|uniref:Uncharacterized protein n=1 Tax=Psylliodes chrysocephalus TaxID=3402493 RepID=A0A9P0GEQ7_9CUCU|nr:unnamed protein product [Psylliodes chrysocephala]
MLQRNNFICKQAESVADCLIVNTAIEHSILGNDSNIVIVAEYIDLLVLLTALAPNSREIFFHKPAKGKQVQQHYSSKSLDYSPCLKEHVLLLHAISGCDTTSSFYGKGKTKLLDLVLQSPTLQEAAATFKQPNANIQEIYSSDVKLILACYSANTY